MRVDVCLVERGFVSSRNRAQELIESGQVFLILPNGTKKPVTKASLKLSPDEQNALVVEVDATKSQFVSRGGHKMQGALERSKLSVKGFSVLDIGISTGGFTDCLLQQGARTVVGVDVGHNQLADKLKGDPRVKLLEGINARDLSGAPILSLNQNQRFDLLVIDVSFISLTLVLPEAIQYLNESASLLALVKPQFEVGREGLGKNGIVKDASRYKEVEVKIREACERHGLRVEDYFESSIEGSDGNREFFIHAKHDAKLDAKHDAN